MEDVPVFLNLEVLPLTPSGANIIKRLKPKQSSALNEKKQVLFTDFD